MRSFRNNNKRPRFRSNGDRGFKRNGESQTFQVNANFQRKSPGKNNHNAPKLIEKYGVPQSMSDRLASYPDKGMYFSLKKNVLVSTWIFFKNSKILSHQLFKSR